MQILVRRPGLFKPITTLVRFYVAQSPRGLSRQLLTVVNVIEKRSPNPIWLLLTEKNLRSRVRLTDTLKQTGISIADYRRWEEVALIRNLDSAIAALGPIGDGQLPVTAPHRPSPGTTGEVVHPPAWLILKLCFKVRSPSEAQRAALFAIAYLPHAAPDVRPSYLIIVAHMLATHGVLPLLDRVVRIFVGLPLYDESWHFNLLLRTLSYFTVSQDSGRFMAQLSIILLNAMTERGLTLTPRTYRVLLENRYIAMELTAVLRQRMIRERIPPDQRHLEAFLKIFAHRGSIHDASTYAEAVRHMLKGKELPPHLLISDSPAFEYLSHLVHEDSWKAVVNADAEWRKHSGGVESPRFVSKRLVTSAPWMARLFSLSRTHSMSSHNLVKFFKWSQSQGYPFPTATTMSYTILLGGLLRKEDYNLALQVWEEYRNLCLRLDRAALTVGLEVLTRAGFPQRAVNLLEEVYSGPRPPASVQAAVPTKRKILSMKGTVETSVINHFMLALIESGRPDSALRIWQHMERLYGTKPDATTLAHMLNAARHAAHSFQSLSGAFKELGLRNPFHRRDDRDASLTSAREEAWVEIRRSFKAGAKRTDMWGDVVAWRKARDIFHHIIFGNWPKLLHVEPPARAVRVSGADVAESPFQDFKRFLTPMTSSVSSSALSRHITPASVLQDGGLHPFGQHPQIAPTDYTFRAYILLLGSRSLAAEIPLALAWMRALEVTPSTPTLAYALVFWAEVSVNAPLLESWMGASAQNEYAKLVRWIRGWVGGEGVPSDADIGHAMRMVDSFRRRRVSWSFRAGSSDDGHDDPFGHLLA